jgi:hypothetical protein
VKNLTCNLNIVDEKHSYFQLNLVFVKPLFRVWLDIDVFRTDENNATRKLLTWKKFDVCKFYIDVNSFPIIKDVIKFIDEKLNHILHVCPYNGLEIKNFSTSIKDNFDPQNSVLPNGQMKVVILAYNNRDKRIVSLKIKWTRNIVFKTNIFK